MYSRELKSVSIRCLLLIISILFINKWSFSQEFPTISYTNSDAGTILDDINLFTNDIYKQIDIYDLKTRAGLDFNLQLCYSSQQDLGWKDKPLGYGWDYSIPFIENKFDSSYQGTSYDTLFLFLDNTYYRIQKFIFTTT